MPVTAAPEGAASTAPVVGVDEQRLTAALARLLGGDVSLASLQRLTGGANMQTWSIDCDRGAQREALILRRLPPGIDATAPVQGAIGLSVEAQLLRLAKRHRVPVPGVRGELCAADGLGAGYLMNRLNGEALPQRLLREARYAPARERFAFQCGEALATIHAIALEDCPGELRDLDWEQDLQRLQGLLDDFGNPSPVHQLALNWLRRQPPPSSPRVLCHGDFRLGNLLLDEQGLVAVLDWELAHIGHAGEDLGYLCANVWRFGAAPPVGGMGSYRQLLDGYRSVRGDAPCLEELRRWEVYAALAWGVVCLTMRRLFESGDDPTLERAAVGRRVSESEVDLLLLLEELGE
jgi:aminoglycoside phosphotransferase (APT) family kinase protein